MIPTTPRQGALAEVGGLALEWFAGWWRNRSGAELQLNPNRP